MSAELGQDFKFAIANSTSPYTFTIVSGQKGLRRNVANKMIDLSSKTSGIYGAKAPGRSDMTIQVSGVRDLPDANGLERCHALANASVKVPARIRILKTSVSPSRVVLEMNAYIANLSYTDDDQTDAGYSFDAIPDGSAIVADDITP